MTSTKYLSLEKKKYPRFESADQNLVWFMLEVLYLMDMLNTG